MGNVPTVAINKQTIKIKSAIAEGGHGSVFIGEDSVSRQKYALKVTRAPKDDGTRNHMLEMEAELHAGLPPHANLVRYHGSKIDRSSEMAYNVFYLLTEYCPKSVFSTMEGLVKRKESFSERDVMHIFTSVLAAVRHLHGNHLAHRDIKVENLLYGVNDGEVKLCDLGSASSDHRVLRNSTEIGYAKEDIERNTTIAYRAPEQVDLYGQKLICEKVDIWALGVLLYKLCYFKTPFEDKMGTVSPMAILNVSYKIPPSPTYPSGLASLIKYMLQPDPDARPTATQVMRRIRELMATGELSPNPDLPALAQTDELPTSPLPRRGSGSSSLASPTLMSASPTLAYNLAISTSGAPPRAPLTSTPRQSSLEASTSLTPSVSTPASTAGNGYHQGTPTFVAPSPVHVPSPTSMYSNRGGGGLRSPSPASCSTPPPRMASQPPPNRSALKFSEELFGDDDAGDLSHSALPDLSNLATVDRARTPPGHLHRREPSSAFDEQGRPRNAKKALGDLWQKRMMKLMGAEQGKKGWVNKATSKEAGAPKAKYVRKIVLAVWEQEMTSSTFFINLYQRPIQANPVVALKGLITTLKLLQQGPEHFLCECVPCVGMIDEIGKHWGSIATKVTAEPGKEHLNRQAVSEGYTTTALATTVHMAGAQSPSPRRQFLDVDSIMLLSRLAHLLVLKLNFHDQHPEFARHFTAVPTMLGYHTVPVSGSSSDMNALSRLLTIQDAIIMTQRLIFAARNDNVQVTGRWVLLPLVEEAYTVFVACTFLLASLLELCASHSSTSEPLSRLHVTALLGLRSQYEAQLAQLQDFYSSAERVEEVKRMRRMPPMPLTNPVALDGQLNWKPPTMKSPLRSLCLQDKARIKEEMNTDPGTPHTPRHTHRRTPSSTPQPADDPAAPADPPTPSTPSNWESFGGATFEAVRGVDPASWFLPSTLVEPTTSHPPPASAGNPLASTRAIPSASSASGLLGGAAVVEPTGAHGTRVHQLSSSPPSGLEDFLRSTAPVYQPPLTPPQPPVAPIYDGAPTGAGPPPPPLHSERPYPPMDGGGAALQPAPAPHRTPPLQSTLTPPASFASLGVAMRSATPPPASYAPAPAPPSGLPPPYPHPHAQSRVPQAPTQSPKDRDAWADFLNDPSSDGRQSSRDGSEARELSVDLMGFSASEDSDTSSDEDDEDSNGGAIVAYNTETMSNIMGTKVDTPPSPPSPRRAAPAVEDRETRSRRREARSQPWRQNMKPMVAAALSICMREFEATGLLVKLEEIVLGEVIGHGAFATVYRGHCLGQDVAVKKLVTQNGLPMAEKSVRDFASEVTLLQQLHHPNIVGLVGTCIDPIALLTEYCHRGNLFLMLNDAKCLLAWERKLSFALGLAEGMHYLHTRDPILIHRDLKSLNVLINRDWTVKVTDFGLSRFKPHSLSDIMTMQCGTYHWMAPEVINSTTYTEKADVYSYGIILWEIYARAIPYKDMNPMQVAAAVVNRMERPQIPADCPPEYTALMRSCWAQDAGGRPSFSDVIEQLKAIPL